jgi:glycosyltransferase involved in cell wall biosynthesis
MRMNDGHTTPLVSILVCTYNGGQFLVPQLESICNQSYSNIEIIIVDDCSIDNTVAILKQYAVSYPDITIFENEKNLGYSKNFEKAMSLAKGEYFSPCDQDDVWDLKKVEEMVLAINGYPLLYCNSILTDENLKSVGKLNEKKCLGTYNNCLVFATDNCVAGHAILISKELFFQAKPFPPDIPHDWWLAYVACFTKGVKYLDKPLVKYRNHSNNVIGAVRINKKRKTQAERKAIRINERSKARKRIAFFYEACPEKLVFEKELIRKLVKSYQSFSLKNNLHRVVIFLNNYKYLLAIKKRTLLRKIIFCVKMFYQLR